MYCISWALMDRSVRAWLHSSHLLLHALKGGEDIGSGDDSDDLSVFGDNREPVDLVLEHDGGGLSDGVGLLDGPRWGGHDVGNGLAALVEVLPGHNADADALAVNDRNARDVVEELLHGLWEEGVRLVSTGAGSRGVWTRVCV